jgi:hypothetical protein
VFHLTAITRRKDALFQTVGIGGARAGRSVLHGVVGRHVHMRVSLRQRNPGEARNGTQRHRRRVLLVGRRQARVRGR